MKNVILVLLTLLVISLSSFLVYDKYFKQEKSVNCPKCKECEICKNDTTAKNDLITNEYNTATGKYLSVSYNENQFTLTGISYKNEDELISSTKTLSNLKIEKAKISNLNSSEDEEVQLIMQDGSVYSAYFGHEKEELYFTKNEALADYKIEDIINIEVSSEGSTYEVLLQDGTTKTINNN